MIPLGLKETKEVDFFEQFSDFILEHYSVDPSNFEDAILDLIDTRQVRESDKLLLIGEIWVVENLGNQNILISNILKVKILQSPI